MNTRERRRAEEDTEKTKTNAKIERSMSAWGLLHWVGNASTDQKGSLHLLIVILMGRRDKERRSKAPSEVTPGWFIVPRYFYRSNRFAVKTGADTGRGMPILMDNMVVGMLMLRLYGRCRFFWCNPRAISWQFARARTHCKNWITWLHKYQVIYGHGIHC